jgi:16S rRNA (cytidine1402-2'-O)-methyltransferase
MNGKLYIVATPIGNLSDMTERAIETLRGADIIAAEDTQTSINLLNKFEIRAKLVSNHKFNEQASCDYLMRELLGGKNIAVISDAGTPCISDPGAVLVRKAVENNIEIEGIPGACAAVTAVSISGFDMKSFTFAGFFPREVGDIKKLMIKLKNNPGIYIFYESPRRIIKTFELFAENLENADICLCNDLTKKFERIYRGTPGEVLAELRGNQFAGKGEYTIVINVVRNVSEISESTGANVNIIRIEAILVDVMLKQNCTLKAAVKITAAEHGLNKNEVYAASLNLKKLFGKDEQPCL